MSYCVNCGVELDDSAKRCALCQTPVINPNKPQPTESEPPFSETEHIPVSVKKQFVAYVISMVFLIPNLVCFLLNSIFISGGFWAAYVNATSFLVWVVFIFPFFSKKFRPYLMWFFDTCAVCAYVYCFFALGNENSNSLWYYKCALPVIITASVLILIYMFWVRARKRHWVLKFVGVLIAISVTSLVTGAVLEYSTKLSYANEVGIIIFICCAALNAFLVYCYKSKRIRRWLSKRFFV